MNGNTSDRKSFLEDIDKKKSKNKNTEINNRIINFDSNDKEKIESYDDLKISDLGPGPIYASGWVKYFKLIANPKDNNNDHSTKSASQTKANEQSINLPKSFNINKEYDQEKRVTAANKYNTKSSDGINILYDYVQNKYLFYAITMKDSLNFVSSRKVNPKSI